MLDMRYHVISLVAVFLALGIGILLGTTLVERGLIAEQKSEIESLQKTFDEIRDKNKSLNDDLDISKEYEVQSLPYMVSGRLPQRLVAVITRREPNEDTLGAINEAIGLAGGSVPVTIGISTSEVYEDQQLIDNLAALFQLPPDPQVLKGRVYAEVVEQLKNASNTGILATLQQLGVLQVRGVLPGPVSGAVLLGSIESANSIENTDLELIRAFVAGEFQLVAVGNSNMPESVMVAYKNEGISTVDHVETIPGQVAMVMVLQGHSGNYGSSKAADRLLPEPVGI